MRERPVRALGTVEVTAHPKELGKDQGRALERRARLALSAGARTLVVRLLPGTQLAGGLRARFEAVRALARSRDSRVVLRPSTPAIHHQLVKAGLEDLVAAQAA